MACIAKTTAHRVEWAGRGGMAPSECPPLFSAHHQNPIGKTSRPATKKQLLCCTCMYTRVYGRGGWSCSIAVRWACCTNITQVLHGSLDERWDSGRRDGGATTVRPSHAAIHHPCHPCSPRQTSAARRCLRLLPWAAARTRCHERRRCRPPALS